MPTPYSKIYERFQQKIQDYTIDEIYVGSKDNYENYLFGFLKSALVKFYHCRKNLITRDETQREFSEDLTELEQEILAQLMLIEWMEKEVNNILEMRMALSSSDFKKYAESQNMKEKSSIRDKMIESADSMKMQYYLINMDVK
ncbi:hypothetical protein F4V43_02535 [Paenibacillus spiritus]|uniref:Uncharacterized protein n=1 Tax=Paenibacillus spiritus TaxID=2496557 RepID=A0A5J5GIQ3_9BACL|nr:hypothetical protein [Paenibacillus spiritus]KAA9007384.1 hypothetical protein F4V43_02535 [Paenibacillus spiritus]